MSNDDDLNCSDCKGVIWHEVNCPAVPPTNTDGTSGTITLDPKKAHLFMLPFESDNTGLVDHLRKRVFPTKTQLEFTYPGLLAAVQIAIRELRKAGHTPISLRHQSDQNQVKALAEKWASEWVTVDPAVHWPVKPE